MTNVKSLLVLYVKMGGSLTDTYSDIAGGIPVGQYSLISDAILACSKKASSGGGSGGGAEKFVVTFTEDGGTWSADKTVEEVYEAHESGAFIVGVVGFENVPFEIPLVCAFDSGEVIGVIFIGPATLENSQSTNITVMGVIHDNTDTWSCDYVPTKELPQYSAANNGQVLGVVDGALAWVTP